MRTSAGNLGNNCTDIMLLKVVIHGDNGYYEQSTKEEASSFLVVLETSSAKWAPVEGAVMGEERCQSCMS